jgi:hypothetical protein
VNKNEYEVMLIIIIEKEKKRKKKSKEDNKIPKNTNDCYYNSGGIDLIAE